MLSAMLDDIGSDGNYGLQSRARNSIAQLEQWKLSHFRVRRYRFEIKLKMIQFFIQLHSNRSDACHRGEKQKL